MRDSYELYLVRHGLAEERGEAWPDDTKRPLTDEGMSRLRQAAHALARLGCRSTSCSPARSCGRGRPRKSSPARSARIRPSSTSTSLAPGGSPTAIVAELEKHARRPHIAIVGHEPGIGELAAWLIGSRNPIEFKKGGICRIDVEGGTLRGAGVLRWMLTPKILRALKK